MRTPTWCALAVGAAGFCALAYGVPTRPVQPYSVYDLTHEGVSCPDVRSGTPRGGFENGGTMIEIGPATPAVLLYGATGWVLESDEVQLAEVERNGFAPLSSRQLRGFGVQQPSVFGAMATSRTAASRDAIFPARVLGDDMLAGLGGAPVHAQEPGYYLVSPRVLVVARRAEALAGLLPLRDTLHRKDYYLASNAWLHEALAKLQILPLFAPTDRAPKAPVTPPTPAPSYRAPTPATQTMAERGLRLYEWDCGRADYDDFETSAFACPDRHGELEVHGTHVAAGREMFEALIFWAPAYDVCRTVFSADFLDERLRAVAPASDEEVSRLLHRDLATPNDFQRRMATVFAAIQEWRYVDVDQQTSDGRGVINGLTVPQTHGPGGRVEGFKVWMYRPACASTEIQYADLSGFERGHRYFLIGAHELGHVIDCLGGGYCGQSGVKRDAEITATVLASYFAECNALVLSKAYNYALCRDTNPATADPTRTLFEELAQAYHGNGDAALKRQYCGMVHSVRVANAFLLSRHDWLQRLGQNEPHAGGDLIQPGALGCVTLKPTPTTTRSPRP